jgi:membrane-anchored glycerophosphoryl diester phosphodiesterase (GDPDase)
MLQQRLVMILHAMRLLIARIHLEKKMFIFPVWSSLLSAFSEIRRLVKASAVNAKKDGLAETAIFLLVYPLVCMEAVNL